MGHATLFLLLGFNGIEDSRFKYFIDNEIPWLRRKNLKNILLLRQLHTVRGP